MIKGVTSVSVLWEEAHRAERLLSCLVEHFERVVVVVQECDDGTWEIAKRVLRPTDALIWDEWRGGGDFSMPMALDQVRTEWVFVISGDEYPTDELLDSIPSAILLMETTRRSGAFIRFEETIEGEPYIEHGKHVRLFRKSGGWEARHHSSAPHENTITWAVGHIDHTRSLDEVVADYTRKYRMMEHEGRTELFGVQVTMLQRACTQTAAVKGWDWVKAHDWWPEVESIAFRDGSSSSGSI